MSRLCRMPPTHFSCRMLLGGHSSCYGYSRPFIRQKHYKPNDGPVGSSLIRYLRGLRWVPIPLGVGFAYIGYQQYGHIREREERIVKTAKSPEDLVAKEWQVKIYKALPLKALSRTWGRVNKLELPVWLCSPLIRLYIWKFNCQLNEAAVRDLDHYKNLGEFFRRRLRPGCRPIDDNHCITCPSDGQVLHFGCIDQGQVEQVKGVTYSLQGLLGPLDWQNLHSPGNCSDEKFHQEIKQNSENSLFHCVIYLAPGDYHGFHSPASWTVQYRRHFPGDLLSVNPGVARLIKGLFNLNERAVYLGTWEHGFFSMVAVGATNVGSIKIYCDKNLETNSSHPEGMHIDENFGRPDISGIPMSKGESFGEFNLGSTIVLVFEAPKNFKFKLKHGQKVKYGQPLGNLE